MLVTLRHSGSVTNEVTLPFLVIETHVVWQERVDVEFGARAVAVDSTDVFDVNDTLTLQVACRVEAVLGRGVTSVRSSMEAPSIGLHDVEFWTRHTVVLGLLGAAVPVVSFEEFSVFLLGGHHHLVHGRDTTTWQLAQVNVIGHVSTEHIRREVGVGLRGLGPGDVGAISVVHGDVLVAV